MKCLSGRIKLDRMPAIWLTVVSRRRSNAYFDVCDCRLWLRWATPALAKASAAVQVRISLASQRMNVSVDGAPYATWAISTGQTGLRHAGRDLSAAIAASVSSVEPIQLGSDAAFDLLLSRLRHSRDQRGSQSRQARVPWLHPAQSQNAKTLFGLVSRHGMNNTSITITY